MHTRSRLDSILCGAICGAVLLCSACLGGDRSHAPLTRDIAMSRELGRCIHGQVVKPDSSLVDVFVSLVPKPKSSDLDARLTVVATHADTLYVREHITSVPYRITLTPGQRFLRLQQEGYSSEQVRLELTSGCGHQIYFFLNRTQSSEHDSRKVPTVSSHG